MIYGTGYGLEETERKQAESAIRSLLDKGPYPDCHVHVEDRDVLGLLRSSGILTC